MGWLAQIGGASRASSIQAVRQTRPDGELSRDRVMWLPRSALGGIAMTPEDALRLSAVWACVTVTAKALASCSWEVFLERDNGDREIRRNVAAWSLLNMRPNPETTAFAFKEAMFIQAMVWGNFYAEIEFDQGGRPAALWPIAPDRCTLERDGAGRLVLVVRQRQGGELLLDYDTVFHVHGPGVDGLSGFEVVTMAARSLAHAAAAERFGQSFYHNNTQLGGLISFTSNLGEEARKATTNAIENGHKGSQNAWGLLTLDNGAKYQSFGVEPDKAQFIETRYLLIEEVCRWFGVPPHKIAHLLRATFGNIEHQSIEFVRDALTPWAERARQEADWKLLRPWPGIRTRLDLEWLQEGDAKSKAETDSILVQNALITRNEARKRRGLNAIGPDGDKLTLQLNMTTLDQIGGPEAPAEEERQAFAARTLIANAVKRAVARRTRIAEQAAADGGSETAFRLAIVADQAEHARYIGHLVGEALAALDIRTEQPRLRDALTEVLNTDVELLVSAYAAGDVAGWCNAAWPDVVTRNLADMIER